MPNHAYRYLQCSHSALCNVYPVALEEIKVKNCRDLYNYDI